MDVGRLLSRNWLRAKVPSIGSLQMQGHHPLSRQRASLHGLRVVKGLATSSAL